MNTEDAENNNIFVEESVSVSLSQQDPQLIPVQNIKEIPDILILTEDQIEEESDEITSDDLVEEIISAKPYLKKLSIRDKSGGKKAIRLSWNIDCNCDVDYYEIYRSTEKYGDYKMIHTTKTGTVGAYNNSKKIQKGITYYYKIRGVMPVGEKTVYTEFSNIRSKKIPKK